MEKNKKTNKHKVQDIYYYYYYFETFCILECWKLVFTDGTSTELLISASTGGRYKIFDLIKYISFMESSVE